MVQPEKTEERVENETVEPKQNTNGRSARSNIAMPSDELEILSIGLFLAGFKDERQYISQRLKLERFRSFYGIGPKAMLEMYKDLCANGGKIKDISTFFLAMNWLRLYDSVCCCWSFLIRYSVELSDCIISTDYVFSGVDVERTAAFESQLEMGSMVFFVSLSYDFSIEQKSFQNTQNTFRTSHHDNMSLLSFRCSSRRPVPHHRS